MRKILKQHITTLTTLRSEYLAWASPHCGKKTAATPGKQGVICKKRMNAGDIGNTIKQIDIIIILIYNNIKVEKN